MQEEGKKSILHIFPCNDAIFMGKWPQLRFMNRALGDQFWGR